MHTGALNTAVQRAPLRDIADLPGPRPWSLLGNLPRLKAGQVHFCLERWGAQYGPQFRFPIGPRYLALLEMKIAMAMLLARFDLRCVDTANAASVAENLAFTMAPVGLRMTLSARG